MEKIVVNDTNIFIDLYKIGLLEEMFSLPWEIHTTRLVLVEIIREGQLESVNQYVTDGRLHIPVLNETEMKTIAEMKLEYSTKTNVSITDCSVWYYALKNKFTLLTGDRKLKSISALNGVEVHGTIYIFDKMVEHKILTPVMAADKLELLYRINHRLPKSEIDQRIKLWRSSL